MRVVQISSWRPIPGKSLEFLAAVSTAKKIQEKHGTEVTVWQSMFGGANSMTVNYVTSSKDISTHTKRLAELQTDTDWQHFWQEQLANPSATLLSHVLSRRLADIDTPALAPNTSGRPRVLEVLQWGPLTPAQHSLFVAVSKDALAILSRYGAIGRILQVMVGGERVNHISASIEYPSIDAYGTVTEQLDADKDWQKKVNERMGASPDAPPILGVSLATELLV